MTGDVSELMASGVAGIQPLPAAEFLTPELCRRVWGMGERVPARKTVMHTVELQCTLSCLWWGPVKDLT